MAQELSHVAGVAKKNKGTRSGLGTNQLNSSARQSMPKAPRLVLQEMGEAGWKDVLDEMGPVWS